MTTAKVIEQFTGRADDETKVRDFHVGEIIKGDLAAAAIKEKWAEPQKEPTQAAGKQTQKNNKAK